MKAAIRALGSSLASILFGILLLTACGDAGDDTRSEDAEAEAATEPADEEGAPAASGVADAVNPALLEPRGDAMTRTAPDSFRVRFSTSEGEFIVQVHRDWAPHGADRFYNLVREGYYDGNRFFRVLDGFVAQWGIHGNPRVSAAWRDATIPPDSVRASNTRGRITFAMGRSPDTRTTQVFVNYTDNTRLDEMGFAPFGEVVEGMDVVEALHSGYGEGAPSGQGPRQDRIQTEGNAYLEAEFPRLDSIRTAEILTSTG